MKTRRTPIELVMRPFQEFASREASGGIVLFAATVAALIVANTELRSTVESWLAQDVSVVFGRFRDALDVHGLVNDGLMAVFFLVVGLEIKRELVSGELSSPKQAVLPFVAALGGMVVPALLYRILNPAGPAAAGWGVPMATDIAFALGVLALLGRRAPYGLKVFLAALAIVDDIGAVGVIAFTYSHGLDVQMLTGSLLVFGGLIVANVLGVRNLLVYLAGGAVMWWFMHHSGVHSTVAGILTAFTVPAASRIDARAFRERALTNLDGFEEAPEGSRSLSEDQQARLHSLERSIERVTSPLQRLIHGAHPWVAFLIVPVFAFANSGIPVDGASLSKLPTDPMAVGIALGLIVGKPLGIVGFSFVVLKAGLASWPDGVLPRHLIGAGFLGGIGFTMAVFISGLAFPDPARLETAKAAVLAASMVSGVLGYALIRARLGRPRTQKS
ncbi:MAG: Na+/H+ antiporter NhaA [Armatimonadetes bacterium]|nr:Na+/H+ antiporter NhaA [Armatimonadota bacterium]